MAEEDVEVSGMVEKWVKLGRPSVDEALSDVTRAKLAAELVLPPGRRRGGPCLRKLVLWTNLLGASTSLLGGALPASAPVATGEPSSAAQAEYDWFEGVMEDIDASDSDSDGSEPGPEGAPDEPPRARPADGPRAAGLRKRRRSLGSDDERARDGPVQRARRLCMALRGMRLLRRRHRLVQALRRRRPPPAPAVPLAPAPETPPQTLQPSHPPARPSCATSLSRLLPSKTSFRFEPPPPGRSSIGQGGIDLSRYEFLISTDDARTGLKYLVGMSTVGKRLVVKKVAVFVGLDEEQERLQEGEEGAWKVFGLGGLDVLSGIWRT